MSEALVQAIDDLIEFVKECLNKVREVSRDSFGSSLILHDEMPRFQELDLRVYVEARKADLIDALPKPGVVDRGLNHRDLPIEVRLIGKTNLPADCFPEGFVIFPTEERWIDDMESLKRLAEGEPAKSELATETDGARYLNIKLDEVRRTVTRVSSDVPPIELTPTLWPLCKLFVDRGASGVIRDQLDQLPGESTARNEAIKQLRILLKPLRLTITDGRSGKRVLKDDASM